MATAPGDHDDDGAASASPPAPSDDDADASLFPERAGSGNATRLGGHNGTVGVGVSHTPTYKYGAMGIEGFCVYPIPEAWGDDGEKAKYDVGAVKKFWKHLKKKGDDALKEETPTAAAAHDANATRDDTAAATAEAATTAEAEAAEAAVEAAAVEMTAAIEAASGLNRSAAAAAAWPPAGTRARGAVYAGEVRLPDGFDRSLTGAETPRAAAARRLVALSAASSKGGSASVKTLDYADMKWPTTWRWDAVAGESYTTRVVNQNDPQYCGASWAVAALGAFSDRIKIGRAAVGDGGGAADVELSAQVEALFSMSRRSPSLPCCSRRVSPPVRPLKMVAVVVGVVVRRTTLGIVAVPLTSGPRLGASHSSPTNARSSAPTRCRDAATAFGGVGPAQLRRQDGRLVRGRLPGGRVAVRALAWRPAVRDVPELRGGRHEGLHTRA